ncbi:MAG: 50S ribosomal protein L15 [Calditrichaeota bacterium]|nr:MAG: 50S ribosomal protein L15 [Calditrichota bacterium]
MSLSNLKYAEGSTKNRKRIGRGGVHGKTSTRGHKGQFSRGGAKHRSWFEGGQMPIMRRLPKRGFTNINRVEYQVVNIGTLGVLKSVPEITPQILKEKGFISVTNRPVKILGHGDLKVKLNVTADAFSKTAVEKIEAAGGKVTKL